MSSASNPAQAQQPSLFGSNLATQSSGPQVVADKAQPTGLFGSQTSQPQSTGLFGGQTSQPQSTGLFGSQTSQPQSTGLFGSQTSQPQSTGLFGSKPSQPGSTGLFGNQPSQPQSTGLFGSQTAQPQRPSLFAAAASTSQPQQPSLFAATNAPQPQVQAQAPASFLTTSPAMQPGLAQAQQPQQDPPSQPSTNSQPAYFDSLLEKGRQRADGKNDDAGLEEIPSLQLGLSDISRQARQLGGLRANIQRGNKTDSSAHYLLAASGISPGAALRDLRQLNAQTATAGSSSSSAFDTDTGAYIANLQTQSTLALISESLHRSARDFDAFLERNVTMDWDAQRQRIYEHFGLVPKGEAVAVDDSDDDNLGASGQSSFGRSTRTGRGQKPNGTHRDSSFGRSIFSASNLQKSVLGSPGRTGADQAGLFADVADKANKPAMNLDDRFLREKESRFADKVQMLNEARLHGRSFPILREFAALEAESGGDQTTNKLVDSYKALIEMVREDPSAERVSDPNAVRERQFAEDYLDENASSDRSMRMKKRITDGSRKFLEKAFFHEIESLIAKYPREALLGGVPTTLNKVRAYVTLRAGRKDLASESNAPLLQKLGDDYCWVLIFYLLRSGHVKEAAEYVTKNSTAFRAIDRNFPTYITNYYQEADRRLRRDLQSRINGEYNQRVRVAPENSTDPYRLACYKIVGRCGLDKRTLDSVSRGVEDWTWLQFSLAREVNRVDEIAGEVFGLDEVRAVIRDIGNRHYAKGQADSPGGPGTFFFLQILGGMFEQAVAYLYRPSYVSAVHFAIALDFYGLLRVSNSLSSDTDLLTFNTKELPQISFGRMIGYYTGDFRSANVEAAVDYLALLCLNADLPGPAGKSQVSLCHDALRELVLETREFAKLLGDVRSDGQRIQGGIEKRLRLMKLSEDEENFLRTVTVQAAAVADDNGRVTDAVLLYHLAEDYDNVIVIINRALSEAIAVDIGQEQMRLQPLKSGSQQKPSQESSSSSSSTPSSSAGISNAKTSLSLASIDDPVELAMSMISLYNQNALYYRKIKPGNRDACGILLRMSEAKKRVAAGQWAEALDIISTLSILPLLQPAGQIALIRQHALAFNALPHPIARTIPHLLTWTITCCTNQRQLLLRSAFDDPTRAALADTLDAHQRDLLVFAGLIRFRVPEAVMRGLARGGGT